MMAYKAIKTIGTPLSTDVNLTYSFLFPLLKRSHSSFANSLTEQKLVSIVAKPFLTNSSLRFFSLQYTTAIVCLRSIKDYLNVSKSIPLNN